MKVTVQVVLHADDDSHTVVREAFTLIREALAPDGAIAFSPAAPVEAVAHCTNPR